MDLSCDEAGRAGLAVSPPNHPAHVHHRLVPIASGCRRPARVAAPRCGDGGGHVCVFHHVPHAGAAAQPAVGVPRQRGRAQSDHHLHHTGGRGGGAVFRHRGRPLRPQAGAAGLACGAGAVHPAGGYGHLAARPAGVAGHRGLVHSRRVHRDGGLYQRGMAALRNSGGDRALHLGLSGRGLQRTLHRGHGHGACGLAGSLRGAGGDQSAVSAVDCARLAGLAPVCGKPRRGARCAVRLCLAPAQPQTARYLRHRLWHSVLAGLHFHLCEFSSGCAAVWL